ncbi:MAG: hypothetical protein IPP35_08765 [Elusimicrobia bacterium]|nr:hypothetical protein [Elusimicrobiota bacterium]
MTHVFIVNDLKGVRKIVEQKAGGPFSYFVFREHAHGPESNELKKAGGIEIKAGKLFSEVNAHFRDDFVSWMGALNNAGHSPFWDGLDLAGKSALSTRVCERVFYTDCLTRLLKYDGEDLVIVFDDAAVLRQIKRNFKNRIIRDFSVGKPLGLRILTDFLPGKVLHRFVVSVFRKTTAGPTPFPTGLQRLVVVKTVLSEGSFDVAGAYRDLYFGDLLPYLQERQKNLLVVGIVLNAYRQTVEYLRRSGTLQVYSIEQLLSVFELVGIFIRAVWMFYSRLFTISGFPVSEE